MSVTSASSIPSLVRLLDDYADELARPLDDLMHDITYSVTDDSDSLSDNESDYSSVLPPNKLELFNMRFCNLDEISAIDINDDDVGDWSCDDTAFISLPTGGCGAGDEPALHHSLHLMQCDSNEDDESTDDEILFDDIEEYSNAVTFTNKTTANATSTIPSNTAGRRMQTSTLIFSCLALLATSFVCSPLNTGARAGMIINATAASYLKLFATPFSYFIISNQC